MEATEREKLLNALKSEIYTKISDLHAEYAVTREPVTYENGKSLVYKKIRPGEKWGELWDCAWFRFRGMLPDGTNPENAVLIIDVAGEGCIYIDGVPARGITNVDSDYDRALGLPGKRVIPFSELGLTKNVDIWVDCACNDLFGKYKSGLFNRAEIAVCDREKREIYYDLWVLDDYVKTGTAPENVVSATENAFAALQSRDFAAIKQAVKGAYTGNAAGVYTACGHAHLDLAWLWPIRETKRKAARTFATFLSLAERYPEYIAGFSQPQQFEWIRSEHPKLFERLQEAAEAGRLEPQGAMWVEADVNLTGGEALIWQLIEGREYFHRYFGVKPDIAHLPDAFGFNGALPQILRGCGVDKFITIKLSWNKYNVFPHTTFFWRGIDGSGVTAHIPPEGVYNSAAAPRSFVKAQRCNAEKEVFENALNLFGIGDGGGGPGSEHLERLRRLRGLSGLPSVEMDSSSAYFEKLKRENKALPEYKGELYLEKHQGTYTTRLSNKLHNRTCEKLLLYADRLCAAAFLRGEDVPDLTRLRREVLLYQFHDILPGSSIDRVYRECEDRYTAIEKKLREKISSLQCAEVREVFPERGAFDGKIRLNGFKAEVAADGRILTEGAFESFNEWGVYEDDGDAWDYGEDYKRKKTGRFLLTNAAEKSDGLCLEFSYGDSKISQTLYREGKTLKSDCTIDWREKDKLLVNEFVLRIRPEYADCGIQFGNIRRPVVKNTPQEKAMTEFCAPRYVDVSDGKEGGAVISETFGYSVEPGRLYMHVLRNAAYPSVYADTGIHRFSFAAYPHRGDFAAARTPFEAEAFFGRAEGPVSAEGEVVVSAVKPSRDLNGVIVRVYEPCGKRTAGKLVPGFAYEKLYETTMDERIVGESGEEFVLEPFKIKTFLFAAGGKK